MTGTQVFNVTLGTRRLTLKKLVAISIASLVLASGAAFAQDKMDKTDKSTAKKSKKKSTGGKMDKMDKKTS
jgi:hypothetical protein